MASADSIVIGDSYKSIGDFILIDNIVRAYPSYNHDNAFELEYGFAMVLLELIKLDGDTHRRRAAFREQESKQRRRK